MKQVSIIREFTFAAAHNLPFHQGLCKQKHGHNYRLEVEVAGRIQNQGPATGMIIDFGDLDAVVRETIDPMDHTDLNNLFPNPTAEIMADYIFDRLKVKLWSIYKVCVMRVRLWETDKSSAQVTGGH